jgi:hypothetical protein
MEVEEKVEKYKAQSTHYLENAFVSIGAGDIEKASEFLWGSIVEALKAVAASRGRELRHHREIGEYARELAKQLGSEAISDVFGNASYLHTNFYEVELTVEEVYTYATRIKEIVGKLISLIPKEEAEREE